MTLVPQQRDDILEILRHESRNAESRGVSFVQLSLDSGISLSTVRRRLSELESQGLAYRRLEPNNSGMRGRDLHLWNLKLDSQIRRDSKVVERAITAAKHGGRESNRHRALKEFVANNPSCVGLPPNSQAAIEYRFLSPDRADIVFSLSGNRRVAIEVELEGESETLAGAWQAAKYRTLLCLEAGLPLGCEEVTAILVAYAIPKRTREFCKQYGIESREVEIILD